jgi:hypothetical protein
VLERMTPAARQDLVHALTAFHAAAGSLVAGRADGTALRTA